LRGEQYAPAVDCVENGAVVDSAENGPARDREENGPAEKAHCAEKRAAPPENRSTSFQNVWNCSKGQ
jgi:hypothetical protein